MIFIKEVIAILFLSTARIKLSPPYRENINSAPLCGRDEEGRREDWGGFIFLKFELKTKAFSMGF
jgi:hypothetical protein